MAQVRTRSRGDKLPGRAGAGTPDTIHDRGRRPDALTFFDADRQAAYAADGYARDNALYLTRVAQAHLELGDIDAAWATASQAFGQSGGVDSARPSDAPATFRRHLAPHRHIRVAQGFPDLTA